LLSHLCARCGVQCGAGEMKDQGCLEPACQICTNVTQACTSQGKVGIDCYTSGKCAASGECVVSVERSACGRIGRCACLSYQNKAGLFSGLRVAATSQHKARGDHPANSPCACVWLQPHERGRSLCVLSLCASAAEVVVMRYPLLFYVNKQT
jgi:hypothetical protein